MKKSYLRFLLLLLFFFSVFNFTNTANSAQPQNTVSTIFSILSYVKWKSTTPLICIINNPALTKQFTTNLNTYNKYQVKTLSVNDLKRTQCDTIIFSTFTAKEEQLILNTYVNFPALSISTNNTQCEEGSAFCLYRKNNQVSFKINLGSVNQTKVHIDPRVLLLAKDSE